MWLRLANGFADSRFIVRPIDKECLTKNFVLGNRPPVAAIPTVISIVSQSEIVPWGHDQFTILHILANLIRPFRLHAGDRFVMAAWRKIVEQGIVGSRGIIANIRLVLFLAIQID